MNTMFTSPLFHRKSIALNLALLLLFLLNHLQLDAKGSQNLERVLFIEIPASSDSLKTEKIPTLLLEEIQILGIRPEQPAGRQPVLVQSIKQEDLRRFQHETAASLLMGRSFSMIRSYGQGNMSLVSQRGFTPSHTRIFWEGIPLNHPMTGSVDLALIPARLLDGIDISPANPAAASGSGGIAGTVSLRTNLSDERFFIMQSVGSYGGLQTGAGAGFQKDNFKGDIRLFRRTADNEYPFIHPESREKEFRDNNQSEAHYLLAQTSYHHNQIKFRSLVWIDEIKNHLPGSALFLSPGIQEDRGFRWYTQAGYDGLGRTHLTFATGWYHNRLDYSDLTFDTKEESTSTLYLLQPEVRHFWNREQETRLSLAFSNHIIESDNYENKLNDHSFSTRMNHVWDNNNGISLYPSFEWENHSKFGNALNPALGVTFTTLKESITLRALATQNRSIPGYNDMYWHPFGNPGLEPEQVRSFETGIAFKTDKSSNLFFFGRKQDIKKNAPEPLITMASQFNLTLFHHQFEKGIRWWPEDDGSFRPQNIDEMQSRGVEASWNERMNISEFRFSLNLSSQFTQTSIQKERFPGDKSVGKQMIYVPEMVHKLLFLIDYSEKFWFQFSGQWVDERYTQPEHDGLRDPLSSYTHVDVQAGGRLSPGKFGMDISTGIKNLLDKSYEVIEGYPVAPRHYHFTLTINFK